MLLAKVEHNFKTIPYFIFEVVHSGKEDDLPPPYSPPKRARIQFDFKRFFRKFFLEGERTVKPNACKLNE